MYQKEEEIMAGSKKKKRFNTYCIADCYDCHDSSLPLVSEL